ncbi:hypothetical protein CsSME_00014397 [Camellia sinensis var. sinensis]
MASTGLAEAYLMRRVLKEKMMKGLEGSKGKPQVNVHQKKVSNGCFHGVFKKIHPTDVSLLDSADRKKSW